MPRYRAISNNQSINVDGVVLKADLDGWFNVTPGSRAEQALLAAGAVSDIPPVGGGLPDGNLGDVTKAGNSLTVPGLATKADATATTVALAAKADASSLAAKADINALRTDATVSLASTTSGPIDTGKQSNPRSIATATTFTFTAQPAVADTYFGGVVRNTSGAAVLVTIPASYSIRQQASITSFLLGPNARCALTWCWDGASYVLYGEPTNDIAQLQFALVGATTARSYPILLSNARPFVVTSVISKCASGTDTATVRIGAVALGGTPNAVSATPQTQLHASANAVAAAAEVTVTFAGGAVDPQIQLVGYYL